VADSISSVSASSSSRTSSTSSDGRLDVGDELVVELLLVLL